MTWQHIRNVTVETMVRGIPSQTDVIVGIASVRSLPLACWIAERLNLPLAYVRPGQAKAYGRQQQHEGAATEGKRICLIADRDVTDIVPLLGAVHCTIIEAP